MNKNVSIIIAVIVALIGVYGAYRIIHHYQRLQNQPAAPTATQPSPQSSQSPASSTKTFTVNADDSSADLTTINVKKGDSVSITFNVNANNVYHGGLDFRSSQVSSGTINPGSSKTLTFTATDSFKFTPYWPSSNIAKPYTISVIVQ